MALKSKPSGNWLAIRSSGIYESQFNKFVFPGQYATFLCVKNETKYVVEKIVECWASLFSPHAIKYALKAGISPQRYEMGVIVQRMINAKASGALATIDPITGDPSKILIEAVPGLGLSLMSGMISPDRFIVDKSNLELIKRQHGQKGLAFILNNERGLELIRLQTNRDLCIDDKEIRVITDLAIRIEKLFKKPQVIEWCIEKDTGMMFILQSRDETMWSNLERRTRYITRVVSSYILSVCPKFIMWL